MSKREWKIYFLDMLESIKKIEKYVEGINFEEFIKDDKH